MQLPDCAFYLFGMGHRRKLLYKGGVLSDALTGEVLRRWEVRREEIAPPDYCVRLETVGGRVTICEDEEGVWLEEAGRRECLTRNLVRLPQFEQHPSGPLLRSLHHELLISIVHAGPVPNLFVYPRPWYRDAAMVCMCLERTGNLPLVGDWIRGLGRPFDRNNAGNAEPDNLGQALYMISLVADASHPLVDEVVGAAEQFREGDHIRGITDFAEHPVYQTKWLKFGLRGLGLADPWRVPEVSDSYSALFWIDFRDAHVPGEPFPARATDLYPYLGWAEAHFHGWRREPPDPWGQYPLTWEAGGGEADYARMAPVCAEYAKRRLCAPHSWHAAEMFLYLTDEEAWPG
jgi:hypothetical protein